MCFSMAASASAATDRLLRSAIAVRRARVDAVRVMSLSTLSEGGRSWSFRFTEGFHMVGNICRPPGVVKWFTGGIYITVGLASRPFW